MYFFMWFQEVYSSRPCIHALSKMVRYVLL
jgi:hypothetical protein